MKPVLRDTVPPAHNPKLASITMLVVGAIFVVIWFPVSMLTGFLADGGAGPLLLAGIFTMMFGPAVFYVVLLIFALRALKRTPSRKLFALLALLSTPIMIGLGIVLVTLASTMPKW